MDDKSRYAFLKIPTDRTDVHTYVGTARAVSGRQLKVVVVVAETYIAQGKLIHSMHAGKGGADWRVRKKRRRRKKYVTD